MRDFHGSDRTSQGAPRAGFSPCVDQGRALRGGLEARRLFSSSPRAMRTGLLAGKEMGGNPAELVQKLNAAVGHRLEKRSTRVRRWSSPKPDGEHAISGILRFAAFRLLRVTSCPSWSKPRQLISANPCRWLSEMPSSLFTSFASPQSAGTAVARCWRAEPFRRSCNKWPRPVGVLQCSPA